MKIFSPILKGTTTVAQGTTNLSGSFTGSLFGTAATASYADNFTVGGTLTAQTINVQIITSSIEFNTGSTRNGALSTNTHQFTGSVLMSGSVGIGTSSPWSKLSVVPAANGAMEIAANLTTGQTVGLTFGTYITEDGYKKGGIFFERKDGNERGTLHFATDSNADSSNVALSDSKMSINMNGNVGIGTSTPVSNDGDSRTFQLGNRLVIQNVIGTQFLIGTNAYYDGAWKYIAAAKYQAVRGTGESGAISFHLASAGTAGGTITNMDGSDIKMIIRESGNVGIGTTSPNIVGFTGPVLTVNGSGNYQGFEVATGGVSRFGIFSQGTIGFVSTRQTGMDIVFEAGAASEKMRISSNGSIGAGGSTTNIYNASDIRLKKNINTITYGLNTVSALNPVKFNWADGFDLIEADKTLLGFIAQEVQEIIPEAVESFGSGVDLNGTVIENTLRVNEKFIIPVLVKAIQELKLENDTLKEILQRNNIQ
jgi:hypothetical protein